jgi:hypothetical protein
MTKRKSAVIVDRIIHRKGTNDEMIQEKRIGTAINGDQLTVRGGHTGQGTKPA